MLGGSFLALLIALFIARLTYFRNHIRLVLSNVDDWVDDSFQQFRALLFTPNRIGDHFPEIILDLAARHLAWKSIQEDLSKLYKQNRFYEGFDIIGAVFSVIMLLFGFQQDLSFKVQWTYNALLFTVTVALVLTSIWRFSTIYRKTNEIEDSLGFGSPHSIH